MPSKIVSHACRVVVQTETGGLDLVLPSNIVVAALIPSIVDLAAASTPGWAADWQLSRVGRGPLSSQHSLADNDIHDGDLLILGVADCMPQARGDVVAGVPMSLDGYPRWGATARRAAGSIISVCASGLSVFALLQGDRHIGTAIAAVLAVVAFGGAVAYGRVYHEALPAVTLGVCAVVTTAVAGYLAVPGETLAPKAMLAAAAAATASIVAARAIACGAVAFTATAAFGLLAAVGAAVAVFLPVGADGAGALLATAAVGLLGLAARVAMRIARVDNDADLTHAILTGVTCGCSAAALLGAVLVTMAGGFLGAAFATVVGVALAMRSGTHVDLTQTSALIAGSAACVAAVFIWAVTHHAHSAHWLSLAAAGFAAGAAALSGTALRATPSPLARRCVELTEYAALAAVVPLACWVSGAFSAIRAL